jgi:integrase
MEGHGAMSIEVNQGKHGKTYTVRVDRIDESGRRRQVEKTFRTMREAKAFEAQWQTEKRQGSLVDSSKITVGELLQDWLADVKRSKAPKTYEGYENTVRVHLLPAFGSSSAQRLSAAQLARFYADKLDGVTGANSVEKCYLRMSQVLDRSVKLRIIPHNVNRDVDKPSAPPAEKKAWTLEEARRFLEVARTHDHHPLWPLALHTGLRRGELLGLRWKDIDFQAGTLRVVQTIPAVYGRPHPQQRTKSGAGRTLDLDPEAVSLLMEHQERQRERRAAIPEWEENDLVFCGPKGKPIWPDDIRVAFNRLVKRAGVPHITTHGQRHTMATLWLAAGVNIKVVQERLGHSRASVTMNIYAHAIPGMQRQAVEQMRGLLDPMPGT